MSGKGVLCPTAHFQYVSGFTNNKGETLKEKSYICLSLKHNTMAKKRNPNVFRISNEEVLSLSNGATYPFPKYTTQIINLANGNAKGTVPEVVGQVSDLIQEFDGQTLDEWVTWYNAKMPDAIENATEKTYNMLVKMREVAQVIDRDMVRCWIKDLVYNKTYCGLKVQPAILSYVANMVGKKWRLATKEEEAKNIDGYIGDVAVQIKPSSFKFEKRLGLNIDVPIIYYEKKKINNKDGLEIEIEGLI